jgi:hypothetical protein
VQGAKGLRWWIAVIAEIAVIARDRKPRLTEEALTREFTADSRG